MVRQAAFAVLGGGFAFLGVAMHLEFQDPAEVVVPRGHGLRVISRLVLVGEIPPGRDGPQHR